MGCELCFMSLTDPTGPSVILKMSLPSKPHRTVSDPQRESVQFPVQTFLSTYLCTTSALPPKPCICCDAFTAPFSFSVLKVKLSRVTAPLLDASFSKAAIDLAIKRKALELLSDQPAHSPHLLSLLYPLRQGASLLASELLKLGQTMPSRIF